MRRAHESDAVAITDAALSLDLLVVHPVVARERERRAAVALQQEYAQLKHYLQRSRPLDRVVGRASMHERHDLWRTRW